MLFHLHAENVLSHLPIRAKTHATYSSVYRLYISPALGQIPLCDIQRIDIARVISKLPPQTAAMTLAVMKSILREAVDHNLIELSPASGVRGPKITVAPRKFLTWEQLSDMDFANYTTQIRFLALHGLRWSEALALEPDDFRNGRVHISKSIHGATKSHAGVRSVPQISEFKDFPRSPKTLRKVLDPHGVVIHSLRHTYAYLLKSQGVHVTTAQKLLGHSDPRITMSVYTQVLDREIDEAGVILQRAVAS